MGATGRGPLADGGRRGLIRTPPPRPWPRSSGASWLPRPFEHVFDWVSCDGTVSGSTAPPPTTAPCPASRWRVCVRSVRTPEFAGVTFHEVACKSALNKVPGRVAACRSGGRSTPLAAACTRAPTATPARRTSTSTWTPGGTSRRRSSSRRTSSRCCAPSWPVRPGGASTWRWARTPTRTSGPRAGTGSCRGSSRPWPRPGRRCPSSPRDRCCAATCRCCSARRRQVPVGIGVSIAVLDPALQQSVEPGTPLPRARLDLVRAVRDAGLPCGVMIAPVLPWLTDTDRAPRRAARRARRRRARPASRCSPLHLRGAVKPWYLAWLAREHPGAGRPVPAPLRERRVRPGRLQGLAARPDGAAAAHAHGFERRRAERQDGGIPRPRPRGVVPDREPRRVGRLGRRLVRRGSDAARPGHAAARRCSDGRRSRVGEPGREARRSRSGPTSRS